MNLEAKAFFDILIRVVFIVCEINNSFHKLKKVVNKNIKKKGEFKWKRKNST